MAGLADTKGHLTKTYQYTVTGELAYGSATYENEYTYNGESYNPNIHSQYLRARYYSVVTASFLTEDSYLGNIREPLTLNRYNYCVSSYLNYVDPSGNNPVMDVLSGVVAAIYRNGTQIVAEPIAVLDMLYDGLAWNDWHGWHEYAEQASISANTFVEDVAASAENKTLYYIGNCAGDVITVYALLKSAGEASAASQNHKAQSRTSLIIGNAQTTNGMHFAIAFEVEGDVTLAAEVSAVGALALPPGDFDGNAMFGGTDDFENLWNSLFIKTGVTGSSGTSRGTKNLTKDGNYPVEKGNYSKASDNYLKKKRIDAHELKKGILGNKARIAEYDIYINKDTGELFIFKKGGKGVGIPTGEFIK